MAIQLRENEIKDVKRQGEIESMGFTVLRFKDEEVLNNMNLVRTAIQVQIGNLLEEGRRE